MDIPKFYELNLVNDLMFNRYFDYDKIHFQLKTRALDDLILDSIGFIGIKDGALEITAGLKYLMTNGVSLSAHYKLHEKFTFEIKAMQTLTSNLNQILTFKTNQKLKPSKVILRNHYFDRFYNLTVDIDFASSTPLITFGTVINLQGYPTGYFVCGEMQVDTNNFNLTSPPKIGFGYLSKRLSVWSIMKSKNEIDTKITYMVSGARLGLLSPYDNDGKVLLASKIHYDIGSKNTSLGIAGKFWLADNNFIKVKWDESQLLSIAFGYFPMKELLITVCGQINPRSVSSRSLHLGCGITYDK